MFETPIHEPPPNSRWSRTIAVLLLLAVAALAFSYLGAYALTGMLVAADVLDRWPPDRDPRPRWMMTSLLTMGSAFLLAAVFVKWSNWRHLGPMEVAAAEEQVHLEPPDADVLPVDEGTK